MLKASFKSVDQLRDFIDTADYGEVKFFVDPDYVDAIIGISDEGKVIYDYDIMVEHLAKIYEKESDCEDPYSDACEWIDYNCNIPYCEIVFRNENDDYGIPLCLPELCENFSDYTKTLIGVNNHGELLIDSECVTGQNIEEIETILRNCEVDYKIV